MSCTLDDPVTVVHGIGDTWARRLAAAFGIHTVRDLLEHYPRRYQRLGPLADPGEVEVGEPATLVGTVLSWSQKRPRGRRLRITEGRVAARGGGVFTVTFFNQPWRARQLGTGSVVAFSGEVDEFRGDLQLKMPDCQVVGEGEVGGLDHRSLQAVYPATEQVPSWRLARWIEAVLDDPPPLEDPLPADLRREHGLLGWEEALRDIHLPADDRARRAARRRLVFDELLLLQLGLQWRRARLEAEVGGWDNAPVPGGLTDRFLAGLRFELTGAQRRALEELGEDLAAERPMHRLLQGDVGAGKTVVAVWAMLCAADQSRQAVLMAPTEVLAEQHHRTLCDLLAPLGVNVLDGVRVELLTSSTPVRQRRRILGELLSGRMDLVVGTHALLEEGVRFADLGVVVIDEQHRFGVSQRVRLKEKAEDESAPDVLVMTATPIPRSLALTLYGDLDVTVLDELPPGRRPVVTELITPRERSRRRRLYEFVRSEAAAGRQAFVVCPLVEESDELTARAVTSEHARLSREVWPDLEVGLLHGRLPTGEKEAVMESFRRGEIDVLVATTVVEVGVDVPAASVMIVEDAERFGISQLHQLRGRVGRSRHRSYCVLFAGWHGSLSDQARERLEAVAETTDGFRLAERDLEIRGQGELFGERQSGLPDLKLARLPRDTELVGLVRRIARTLLAEDPGLRDDAHRALRRELFRRYQGGLEEFAALETG